MTKLPDYQDFISPELAAYLQKKMRPAFGIANLYEVDEGGGLETQESLEFLCELYNAIAPELAQVLEQRVKDREFIDARVRACFELNKSLNIDYLDPDYQTVLGHEDSHGRIVVGPKTESYCSSTQGAQPVAPLPDFLKGPHVTLFGPPDDPKLSINAMNAFHRKIKGEPAIIAELLKDIDFAPKWGADDEDSKTPLRRDLVSAGQNLTDCLNHTIKFNDPQNGKTYELEGSSLAHPIKRFPGLALPCTFLFYKDRPMPLHLYDFALHLFKNWQNPQALSFYAPKLENEDEARYIKHMVSSAEDLLQKKFPTYKKGTIRLFIVLENPRAIFRTHEIMDELHPYFAGASLGWHDYLASTARLFKEDGNYRIPVKADPNIVIKYIKASHSLLADVVGPRGGIKIGGMYGILPIENDLKSQSFQITMRGYFKDVITQLKRDLTGFWVAHPDFVRIGMAIVNAWELHKSGSSAKLEQLISSLLTPEHHKEVLQLVRGADIVSLDKNSPLYARSLIVADIKESQFIANNHPDEIRYNVFQSLQYLTDWLSGNGCVALPAQVDGVSVRVMDDLATAERSRWEVWHEIRHGRFSLSDFLRIAHEEMHFIRKDLSNPKKIVQVKWSERTEKWYPIAFRLMLQLMTSSEPVEFASQLLLPFTIESIRKSEDSWAAAVEADSKRFVLDAFTERFNKYFSACGSQSFADEMASFTFTDLARAEKLIKSFNVEGVREAAAFHGDIGENRKTLDAQAASEQSLVASEQDEVKSRLLSLGLDYLGKFGFKFLIAAQGKTATEIMTAIEQRLKNSPETELENAKTALWQIAAQRLAASSDTQNLFLKSMEKSGVNGAMISISSGGKRQNFNLGFAKKNALRVNESTRFELASLSKTLASCFAIEFFQANDVGLDRSVNSIFALTPSPYRIPAAHPEFSRWAFEVTLKHLMNHTALNMHYVNGVPLSQTMPSIIELLIGHTTYQYDPVQVVNPPGVKFQYSGGGFLVLEHLIETLAQKPIHELTKPYLQELGLKNTSFHQKPPALCATGYLSDGTEVIDSRKIFPAFAAGAMGTAEDMQVFLEALTLAANLPDGYSLISRDTALQMLTGENKSSQTFMGADMGLGVFVLEAGTNRFAIHQGANDGFRCLFMHCFDGPDRGKGFTILCNADANGVPFIAEAAQAILKEMRIEGIDFNLFKNQFETGNIPQAELINRGYKELIFSAFQKDLPEAIIEKGDLDPLSNYNVAAQGKILNVSNQRFARAENLLSPFLPAFDPDLYGRQGKIMDSWESSRHNSSEFDELTFEIAASTKILFVSVSTAFHNGNHPEFVQIDGLDGSLWKPILAKTQLSGHSLFRGVCASPAVNFKTVRVRMFPDGGLTRIGLFGANLPANEQALFRQNTSMPVTTPIPSPRKPLTPKYVASADNIAQNWLRMAGRQEINVASLALGAKVLSASNEHYGPAAQIISPYPPIHMFDGFESARSRVQGHCEEVLIELAKKTSVHRVEVDFTYFRNNNPVAIQIDGLVEFGWMHLVPRHSVKHFAGRTAVFEIPPTEAVSQLKITCYPDGGINRVRAFALNE